MNLFRIFLFLLPIYLFGDISEVRPAPLFSIYQDPSPMTLNGENQIEESLEFERQYNKDRFNEREIPWGWLVLNGAILSLIFLFQDTIRVIRSCSDKISHFFGPETSKTKALKKLKLLEESKLSMNLAKNEEGAKLYIQVIDLMRTFIEEHYHLQATHQTTQEFLEELAHSPDFNSETRYLIEKFMHQADLIKFAKVTVGPQEYALLLQSAHQFIELE